MARSMGGGGRSGGGGSIGGGRSMGGGGRSVSRSYSGSGRSHVSGSGGARRVGGNSYSGSGYNSYNNGYHDHHHHNNHYYYGGSGRRYYSSRPAAAGCSSMFALVLIILVLVAFSAFSGNKSNSTGKKLNKDKFEGAVYDDLGYYLDESDPSMGGFIDSKNEKKLINGMKNFYSKTGVFPFLYIVEDTNGENPQKFGEKAYETLFTDEKSGKPVEGNLLILFVASAQGGTGDYFLIGGLNIGATIDDSAIDEICNQINSRWDNGDLGYIIGDGLSKAADNIMAKSNGAKVAITIIICLAVIIVVLILFKWWKAKKAQQNKEQEDLEKLLSTPLESFGNPMSDLTQKYDDMNQQ